MAHERKCIIDNKIYEYCPRCGNNPNETWRFLYCSEDCRNADTIIKKFKANKISALEARNELSAYEFDKNNGTVYTTPLFAEIYKDETFTIEAPVESVVVEEIPVPVVEGPRRNSKKNNKRNWEKKEIVNDDLNKVADNKINEEIKAKL